MNAQELEKRAIELGIDADDDSWDDRELGADERFVRVSNRPISIRLPHNLVASLKAISGDLNLGYQTYIKMVLSEHVLQKKKQTAK